MKHREPWDGLPNAVPPDNKTKAAFASGPPDDALHASDFSAPDMATPQYARSAAERQSKNPAAPAQSLNKARRIVHEEYEEIVEEDDDEDEDVRPVRTLPVNGNLSLMIAITALLAALAAIVVAVNQRETPLCSSQPEWNQYNCRAG